MAIGSNCKILGENHTVYRYVEDLPLPFICTLSFASPSTVISER